MKSKLLVFTLSLLLCLLLPTVAFADPAEQLAIQLEGNPVQGKAFVSEGTLFIPFSPVAKSLGYNVVWSGKDKTITASSPEKLLEIRLSDWKFTDDDHELHIEWKMENGLTYMNEAFFEDILGLNVTLDGATVEITDVKENPITITNKRENLGTEYLLSNVQYPEIGGLDDPVAQEKINAAFKSLAEGARNEGIKNAEEMKKAIESGASWSPNKCETYFNYRVKYNQEGLISIVFYNYQYTGGAHGLTVQSSYTFDLETGQELGLKNLFAEGTDYVVSISDEVKKQMQEQGLEQDLLTPFESISENQDFYLTKDALVVYFQQYEYLPYAHGVPEFAIKYPLLNSSFRPGFEFLK